MSRIIAGSRRGRKLLTPAHSRTRPTSDRVREALFAAVAVWAGAGGDADRALEGLAVCDLYAGSGALGLEAASRGAAPVLLVESDRATADLIRRNARALELAVEVRAAKVETALAAPATRAFDLVVLDPPYALPADSVDGILALLSRGGWVAQDGLVVVERSSRGAPPRFGAGFSQTWQRGYGETTLHFAMTDTGEETE